MKCLAGKEKPVETYYGHLLLGNTQIMQIFLDYQQLWTSWEELQWPRGKKRNLKTKIPAILTDGH